MHPLKEQEGNVPIDKQVTRAKSNDLVTSIAHYKQNLWPYYLKCHVFWPQNVINLQNVRAQKEDLNTNRAFVLPHPSDFANIMISSIDEQASHTSARS